MGDTSPLSPTVANAAAWITCYLKEHPKATDSAEGIQRWWLAPHYGEVALLTVELALVRLESEGIVQISDSLALSSTYGRGPSLPVPL